MSEYLECPAGHPKGSINDFPSAEKKIGVRIGQAKEGRRMTDQQAFIEAINADSADMHTRRVYADWLEERGDSSAAGWRVLNETGRVPARFGANEMGTRWVTFWPIVEISMAAAIPESGISDVIESAGFRNPCPGHITWKHPDCANSHRTATEALQVAAECIVELTARGVDIKADEWPGQEVEA